MVKKNNKDKLTSFIIGLVVVFFVGSLVLMIVKEIKSNSQNHIKEVSYSSYIDEIKEDKYTIVLLARDGCSHCLNYKPLMNEVLKKYNLNAIYLNVDTINGDDFKELHSSITALSQEFENGIPVIPTPTTVIFKNNVELESVSANIGYDGFLNMLVRNGVVNNAN